MCLLMKCELEHWQWSRHSQAGGGSAGADSGPATPGNPFESSSGTVTVTRDVTLAGSVRVTQCRAGGPGLPLSGSTA